MSEQKDIHALIESLEGFEELQVEQLERILMDEQTRLIVQQQCQSHSFFDGIMEGGLSRLIDLAILGEDLQFCLGLIEAHYAPF